MNDFTPVLESQDAAHAFIAETGGMPEIERASTDLQAAITATGDEIAEATFAPSRFPTTTSDYFDVGVSANVLSPRTKELIAAEGEAGYKRAQLESALQEVQRDLDSILGRLVSLRCDLKVSQIDF